MLRVETFDEHLNKTPEGLSINFYFQVYCHTKIKADYLFQLTVLKGSKTTGCGKEENIFLKMESVHSLVNYQQ